ncbi:hypothetical protein [Nostoc sp. ATCC 53789]|uniref:hypothetical protein n=1 Tax=Nostoc sp. ATCC 53789 TaxID=76335 RepID=UPI00132E97D0|nr:hypothetical protein [Nostoc sp. ATCC 53789]QHG16272.1 hypothetical protein GJB62_10010 [Nostoc sp. ATCC 53789]
MIALVERLVYFNERNCDRWETKLDNHTISKNSNVIAWLIFCLFILPDIEQK